jgi:K+-sensing histidine kinase KdpD
MVWTIQESSEWMNRMIQELLDIASIETGHLSIDRHPVMMETLQTPRSCATP